MKKTLIVDLPEDLHTKIKIESAKMKLSIKDYVTRVLLEKLIQQDKPVEKWP